MARKQSKWRSDQEWFEIITACRQSGLSDAKWCEANGIPGSSLWHAIKRLQSKAYAIPTPTITDVNPLDFTSNQEVVRIDITQDSTPAKYDEAVLASKAAATPSYLDNSHTIEIQIGDTVIRLSNNADPTLVKIITLSLMNGGNYAC